MLWLLKNNKQGIDETLALKLKWIIPNFGCLLELYLTCKFEDTFKALLDHYAGYKISSLELIVTSCKEYNKIFGFKFIDVHIRPNQEKLEINKFMLKRFKLIKSSNIRL